MSKYKFFLGAASKLCLAELSAVLNLKNLKLDKNNAVEIELPDDNTAKGLIHQLGGVVEIQKEGIKLSRYSWRAWLKRDRNKPYSDHKKGMLPPKVARMMVNIALANWQKLNPSKNSPLLFDPFCGTGTVLMEAALEGLEIVGADIDKKAVAGTKKNLDWLKNEYQLDDLKINVFTADSTQVKAQDFNKKINLIVTEPFLGKPRPKIHELANIYKGLEKMYLGTFKKWVQILADQAIVMVVFPTVTTKEKKYDLHKLIDKLEKLGYITIFESIAYSRPTAIVKRQIYTFKYLKNVKS